MQPRVACIQMTSTQDVQENLNLTKNLIEQAVEQEARLIILPEMFALMGLDQTDKVKHRENFGSGLVQDFLHEQALSRGIWIVGGTIPIAIADNNDKVRATCLVLNDKAEIVGRYDKVHLF